MKKLLPLKIVIQIDSTNLSTRRYALERLCEIMNETGHLEPQSYQVIWDKKFGKSYWRIEILECVNSLPPIKRRKPLTKKGKLRA